MDDKYQETVGQVVEMLRSYRQEPSDITFDTSEDVEDAYRVVQVEMAETLFSELIQYVPEDAKADLKKQFNRSR